MELTGAISEGEWSSLSGNFTAEEAVFMAQLLDTTSSLPTHLSFGGLSSSSSSSSSSSTFSSSAVAAAFWPGPQNAAATAMAGLDEASYYSSERPSPSSFYRFFQDSSDFSGGSCSQFPTENYFLGDSHPVLASSNNGPVAMSFCFGDQLGNNGGFRFEDDDDSMNPDMSESNVQPSSQADQLAKPEAAMEDDHNQLENYKKRSRESEEVPKMRNSRSKKAQMVTSTSNTEEDGNGGHSRQSTSNYCSEDESNVSQELNGGANNSGLSRKGPAKTRASRGSATDPQSLYARKRRERINERLKILQSLVPNGTKVDISTMLEEAVQYVKFLQLQIKLLSSDDLWMYAPIAYNGMDIGLNPNPNTLKES